MGGAHKRNILRMLLQCERETFVVLFFNKKKPPSYYGSFYKTILFYLLRKLLPDYIQRATFLKPLDLRLVVGMVNRYMISSAVGVV